MIAKELLIEFDAKNIKFSKGEYIFKEGENPRNYYQIITGQVKMFSLNDDGKEFVHGIFSSDNTFGEPPLFISLGYPANAMTLTDVELFCLSKDKLEELLMKHPKASIGIIKTLSKRLHYKSVMSVEIAFENPEHRIMKLLKYNVEYLNLAKEEDGYKIDITRQQIADLTGLRVETVIKTVKKLEKMKAIKLINKKIYLNL